jgi:hypothetical protein
MVVEEGCTGKGVLAVLPMLDLSLTAPSNNGPGGGNGRTVVIIPELFRWIVTAQLGILIHCYRDPEAMPRPVDVDCTMDARFYSSLFQNPSRVVMTCYSPEATNIHGVDKSVSLESFRDVMVMIALFVQDRCGLVKEE